MRPTLLTTAEWKCHRSVRLLAMLLMVLSLARFVPQHTRAQSLPSQEECDCSAWVLRVGGQIVNVNPDGSFLIPNIQAPDQFGPGGPGTVPDFLSDDLYRGVGTSTQHGLTLYAYTEYFRVRQGTTYVPTNWTLTYVPPPMPEFIRAVPDKPALTEINETTQLRVTATLPDGTLMDVSSAELWTTFRTSNGGIVEVDAEGRLTARGRGTAYITAINDSATAVAQIDVIPGGQLTTVHGLVQTPDGTPVPNIQINLVGPAGTTVTEADGSFTIQGVSSEVRIAAILARGPFNGETVFGRSESIAPVPSGITDAGIIVVRSCVELNIDCLDTDNDCLPDSIERAIRLDPLNPDTGSQGIPDGEKDTDGDGITNCMEVLLGTNPGDADSDDDGIDDFEEISRHGTDPRLNDTDGDSLSDGAEVRLGTNPMDNDTDNDGWNDGGEVLSRSNPLNAESNPSQHVASDDVFYINALLASIDRGTFQKIVSSIVTYSNGIPSAADSPMQIVASPSVSYLNGVMETVQNSIPTYISQVIGSSPVSYLNGMHELRPESLPHTAFSLSVSYLNGLPATAGKDWFIISPIVSYRNDPPLAPQKLTQLSPSAP